MNGKAMLRLMRPRHYLKNGLILVPLIFSGRLGESGLAARALGAAAVFCLLSSVVYIINDIQDAPADRQHTTKRLRPIASGAVSVPAAVGLAALLLALAAGLMGWLRGGAALWAVAGLYVALNLLYSVAGLKHVAVVDVLILASGFFLRMQFGALAVGVPLSDWLALTVIAAAFYMAFGKRRNEMRTEEGATRPVLRMYNEAFLDKSMSMCLTLSVAFYALWSIDARTVAHHANPYAIWTVPLVLAMVFRYSLLVERPSSGDPMELILRDRMLWALGALYALAMYWMIYGG